MNKLKEFEIIVTLDCGMSFPDAVDAENEEQVVQWARWNWENAEEIEIVRERE